MSFCQRNINVFEEGFGDDGSDAAGGLGEVVAGAAGLLATESVGENQRFSELTSTHQETGAVNGPLAFEIHAVFQIHECFLSSVIGADVCF